MAVELGVSRGHLTEGLRGHRQLSKSLLARYEALLRARQKSRKTETQ